MEEILARQIKSILTAQLPAMLVLVAGRDPAMTLTSPAKYVCCEAFNIDRATLPTVQIFSPSDTETGYSLSWSDGTEGLEHMYKFYVDIWINGSDPETLYYKILRYKEAIKLVLKSNIGLGGYAIGSVVRGSYNSNLMGTSDRLVIAGRLDYSVLSNAFYEYPKIDVLANT